MALLLTAVETTASKTTKYTNKDIPGLINYMLKIVESALLSQVFIPKSH